MSEFRFATRRDMLTEYRQRVPEADRYSDERLYSTLIAHFPHYADMIEENFPRTPDGWVGPRPSKPIHLVKGGKALEKLARKTTRRGFWEATFDLGLNDIPFLADVVDVKRAWAQNRRLEALHRGAQLSDEDLVDLNLYMAQRQRLQDATILGKVGETIQQSMKFMTEIYIVSQTGGLAGGLKPGVKGGSIAATEAVNKLTKEALLATGKTSVRELTRRQAAALAFKSNAVTRNIIVNDWTRRMALSWAASPMGQKTGKHLATKAAGIMASGLYSGAYGLGMAFSPLMVPKAVASGQQKRMQALLQGDDMTQTQALFMGWLDTAIELTSEQMGEALISGTGYMGGKFLERFPKARSIPAAYGRAIREFLTAHSPQRARDIAALTSGFMYKVLMRKFPEGTAGKAISDVVASIGLNNTIEEVAEERFGDFLRGLLGLEGESWGLWNAIREMIPSFEQLTAEALAFTMPGMFMQSVNTLHQFATTKMYEGRSPTRVAEQRAVRQAAETRAKRRATIEARKRAAEADAPLPAAEQAASDARAAEDARLQAAEDARPSPNRPKNDAEGSDFQAMQIAPILPPGHTIDARTDFVRAMVYDSHEGVEGGWFQGMVNALDAYIKRGVKERAPQDTLNWLTDALIYLQEHERDLRRLPRAEVLAESLGIPVSGWESAHASYGRDYLNRALGLPYGTDIDSIIRHLDDEFTRSAEDATSGVRGELRRLRDIATALKAIRAQPRLEAQQQHAVSVEAGEPELPEAPVRRKRTPAERKRTRRERAEVDRPPEAEKIEPPVEGTELQVPVPEAERIEPPVPAPEAERIEPLTPAPEAEHIEPLVPVAGDEDARPGLLIAEDHDVDDVALPPPGQRQLAEAVEQHMRRTGDRDAPLESVALLDAADQAVIDASPGRYTLPPSIRAREAQVTDVREKLAPDPEAEAILRETTEHKVGSLEWHLAESEGALPDSPHEQAQVTPSNVLAMLYDVVFDPDKMARKYPNYYAVLERLAPSRAKRARRIEGAGTIVLGKRSVPLDVVHEMVHLVLPLIPVQHKQILADWLQAEHGVEIPRADLHNPAVWLADREINFVRRGEVHGPVVISAEELVVRAFLTYMNQLTNRSTVRASGEAKEAGGRQSQVERRYFGLQFGRSKGLQADIQQKQHIERFGFDMETAHEEVVAWERAQPAARLEMTLSAGAHLLRVFRFLGRVVFGDKYAIDRLISGYSETSFSLFNKQSGRMAERAISTVFQSWVAPIHADLVRAEDGGEYIEGQGPHGSWTDAELARFATIQDGIRQRIHLALAQMRQDNLRLRQVDTAQLAQDLTELWAIMATNTANNYRQSARDLLAKERALVESAYLHFRQWTGKKMQAVAIQNEMQELRRSLHEEFPDASTRDIYMALHRIWEARYEDLAERGEAAPTVFSTYVANLAAKRFKRLTGHDVGTVEQPNVPSRSEEGRVPRALETISVETDDGSVVQRTVDSGLTTELPSITDFYETAAELFNYDNPQFVIRTARLFLQNPHNWGALTDQMQYMFFGYLARAGQAEVMLRTQAKRNPRGLSDVELRYDLEKRPTGAGREEAAADSETDQPQEALAVIQGFQDILDHSKGAVTHLARVMVELFDDALDAAHSPEKQERVAEQNKYLKDRLTAFAKRMGKEDADISVPFKQYVDAVERLFPAGILAAENVADAKSTRDQLARDAVLAWQIDLLAQNDEQADMLRRRNALEIEGHDAGDDAELGDISPSAPVKQAPQTNVDPTSTPADPRKRSLLRTTVDRARRLVLETVGDDGTPVITPAPINEIADAVARDPLNKRAPTTNQALAAAVADVIDRYDGSLIRALAAIERGDAEIPYAIRGLAASVIAMEAANIYSNRENLQMGEAEATQARELAERALIIADKNFSAAGTALYTAKIAFKLMPPGQALERIVEKSITASRDRYFRRHRALATFYRWTGDAFMDAIKEAEAVLDELSETYPTVKELLGDEASVREDILIPTQVVNYIQSQLPHATLDRVTVLVRNARGRLATIPLFKILKDGTVEATKHPLTKGVVGSGPLLSTAEFNSSMNVISSMVTPYLEARIQSTDPAAVQALRKATITRLTKYVKTMRGAEAATRAQLLEGVEHMVTIMEQESLQAASDVVADAAKLFGLDLPQHHEGATERDIMVAFGDAVSKITVRQYLNASEQAYQESIGDADDAVPGSLPSEHLAARLMPRPPIKQKDRYRHYLVNLLSRSIKSRAHILEQAHLQKLKQEGKAPQDTKVESLHYDVFDYIALAFQDIEQGRHVLQHALELVATANDITHDMLTGENTDVTERQQAAVDVLKDLFRVHNVDVIDITQSEDVTNRIILVPDAMLKNALRQVEIYVPTGGIKDMERDTRGNVPVQAYLALKQVVTRSFMEQEAVVDRIVDEVIARTGLSRNRVHPLVERLHSLTMDRLKQVKESQLRTALQMYTVKPDAGAQTEWVGRMLELIYSGAIDPNVGSAEQRAVWEAEFARRFHIPHLSETIKAALNEYARQVNDEAASMYSSFKSFETADPTIRQRMYLGSIHHRRALAKMQAAIMTEQGHSFSDLASALFFSFTLSAPSTSELNFLGTLPNAILSHHANTIAMLSTETTMTGAEKAGIYMKSWNQFLQGFHRGLKTWWHMLKTNEIPGAPIVTEQELAHAVPRTLEMKPFTPLAARYGVKWLGQVLDGFRLVARNLSGNDYAFARAVTHPALYTKLQIEAAENGLTGAAADFWVSAMTWGADGLDMSQPGTYAQYLRMANEYAGSASQKAKATLRHRIRLRKAAHDEVTKRMKLTPGTFEYHAAMEEMMYTFLPEGWRRELEIAAGRGTYNIRRGDPLHEGRPMTSAMQSIRNARYEYGLTQFIFPFIKIATMIFNTGVDMSPLGWMNLRAMQHDMELGDKGTRGVTELDVAYMQAQMLTGSILLGTLATVAFGALMIDDEDPVLDITARGPQNHALKNQLRETGYQEYTIKIGNTRWNYQMTPLAVPLALVGSLLDEARYESGELTSIGEHVATAAVRAMPAMLDQTFIQTFSDLLAVLSSPNPATQKSKLTNLLTHTGTAFFVPNAAKQISRFIDPTLRDSTGVLQEFMQEMPTPFPTLFGGRPRLNALGEVIKLGPGSITLTGLEPLTGRSITRLGRLVTFERQDQDIVWGTLAKNLIVLPTTSKGILLDGVPMSDDQLYRFIQRRGQFLRAWIEDRIRSGNWSMLSREEMQADVRRMTRTLTPLIKSAMITEDWSKVPPRPPEREWMQPTPEEHE